MTTIERLRAVPRPWLTGGAVLLVVALLVTVLAISGSGGDGLATAGPTDAAAPTSTVDAPEADEPTSSTIVETTLHGPATTNSAEVEVQPPLITVDVANDYELDIDVESPAVAGRALPDEPDDEPPPVTVEPPPWAATTRVTDGGHLAVDVGCAGDTSAGALDVFFSQRVGPVLGWDYQHVYPLGGDRHLWLFQDAFVDHSGTRTTLGSARFVHNAAMLQDGDCFTLLHRGTSADPQPFEVGFGDVDIHTKWLWPMGGELVDGRLHVFWAEMVKDPYEPVPPDGLGWHPNRTLLASYDALTLERTEFESPPNPGVAPIYGYAVSSDDTHTYLFGNTFEQNMVREGGFWNGPHSATKIYLARVPRGRLTDSLEYAAGQGWSNDPADAQPIIDRFFAENPMQPRYLDGQWVAATAVDGYWGDHLVIDVAPEPWGPWSTIEYSPLLPRNADPKMNTYHAHLLPWRDAFGSIQISVSNNARNMRRDAWNSPHRYRPTMFSRPFTPTPQPPPQPPPTTSTTLPAPTTTSSMTSTTTSTTTSATTTSAATEPTSPTTTTTVVSTTTSTTITAITSTTAVPTTTIPSTTTSTAAAPTTVPATTSPGPGG